MSTSNINLKNQELLTHDELLRILDYNPDTGIFTWKIDIGINAKQGDIAGTRGSIYVVIKYRGRPYKAHRLAWFYIYKEWPSNLIDHRDRDPNNNAISNLMVSNKSKNAHNTILRSTNVSGYKGVRFKNLKRGWVAYITINRKQIHLGYFLTEEHAIQARKEAEEKYFENTLNR